MKYACAGIPLSFPRLASWSVLAETINLAQALSVNVSLTVPYVYNKGHQWETVRIIAVQCHTCCGMAWSLERYVFGSDVIGFEIQSRFFSGPSRKFKGFKLPHLQNIEEFRERLEVILSFCKRKELSGLYVRIKR